MGSHGAKQKRNFRTTHFPPRRDSPVIAPSAMDEEFPFALLVEGGWDPQTPKLKNKLTIYFQSKKSNGGDCVIEYEVSQGTRVRVCFKTEEGKAALIYSP